MKEVMVKFNIITELEKIYVFQEFQMVAKQIKIVVIGHYSIISSTRTNKIFSEPE